MKYSLQNEGQLVVINMVEVNKFHIVSKKISLFFYFQEC